MILVFYGVLNYNQPICLKQILHGLMFKCHGEKYET